MNTTFCVVGVRQDDDVHSHPGVNVALDVIGFRSDRRRHRLTANVALAEVEHFVLVRQRVHVVLNSGVATLHFHFLADHHGNDVRDIRAADLIEYRRLVGDLGAGVYVIGGLDVDDDEVLLQEGRAFPRLVRRRRLEAHGPAGEPGERVAKQQERGLRLPGHALIGTVAALALAPLVRSMLFETSTYDFGVLEGVAGVLALVAAAASALPAWRASRVSPSITLQSE